MGARGLPRGDPEALNELYVERGWTIVDVAGELNCTHAAVRNRLREFGIETRPLADTRLDDPERLEEWYLGLGWSMADIAEECTVTEKTVLRRLREFGIETRRPAHDGADPRLSDEEWLAERYEDDEMTMEEIADELGCSQDAVGYRLHSFGIETRPAEGNIVHPVECDELGLELASGWEHRVAHLLYDLGAGVEYEPGWLGTPAGRYLPDFVLGDGTIVEVKGRTDWDTKDGKLEHLMEGGRRVVVVGRENARETLPHDVFVPYEGGECPGLADAVTNR